MKHRFQDFRDLSYQILHYANRGFLRIDFLREISKIIRDFSGCDAVELHVKERGKYYRCASTRHPEPTFCIETTPYSQDENGEFVLPPQEDLTLQRLRWKILRGYADFSSPSFTKSGSFWTGDTDNSITLRGEGEKYACDGSFDHDRRYRSLALIPIVITNGKNEKIGLLELKSTQRDYFTEDDIEFYEGIAGCLGVALRHRRAQVELRERIKELTCLYGIARVVERPGVTLDEMLQNIVQLLPPAWLYPEIAQAKIIVDGRSYSTPGFRVSRYKQSADIRVDGQQRGVVEVVYTEEKPELDEGPFLKEERDLIEAIARELELILERRKAEEDKIKLQDQLRHVDRLATIGKLSAGVAHELNEPLGNILGFAQLAKKTPRLPKQMEHDLEKIITASLYAREIIKKLLIFARQMPQQKTQVNLNQVVKEGLSFFESRCAKEGIELVYSFAPDLPEITADPSQLTQVLVNLVVNAIQAMPKGGRLTVQTLAGRDHVLLIVEDTGVGMSEEVTKQIFLPFYTTKEIGQGTGLGLSVVHGIVTSHGGFIKVDSTPCRGTRFEVQLPVNKPEEVEENDELKIGYKDDAIG